MPNFVATRKYKIRIEQNRIDYNRIGQDRIEYNHLVSKIKRLYLYFLGILR